MVYRKNAVFVIITVIVITLVIAAGGILIIKSFGSSINAEKMQQLEAITSQTSATFENSIHFNLACVDTAENLFSERTCSSPDDVVSAADYINATINNNDESCIIMFLDNDGYCYDGDGKRGIWGDFDRITGNNDRWVFIADSTTYDGIHWAFVKKIKSPAALNNGRAVTYVVLLKRADVLNKYYKSDAYGSSCQTYILQQNGTRMYDSLTTDDVIQAYNVYKYLRGCDPDFDSVTAKLEESQVCGSSFTAEDGNEYCYCLARQKEYGIVLLFLVPTNDVATSTTEMVSSMTVTLILTALIILCLVGAMIFMSMRLFANKKLYDEKQRNLQETMKMSERLTDMNHSLLQANKNAEAALDIARSANKAKSNFLSNMSHDIRTPLNAIIGFLQLLEKNIYDPERVRMYVGKIKTSSRQLLSLINDILDMSRIESGKTNLNVSQFAMGEMINEVVTVIAPQASAKEQTFIAEYEPVRNIHVTADKLKLSQVLTNLLSNAVKYTQNGGRIQLKATQLDSGGRHSVKMKFVVTDNGIGMSEEFQHRLFEPFEREQARETTGTQGTGLGMTITKNLVDLMGGIITVSSARGRGSTFTVELSFVAAENDAEYTAADDTARKSGAADDVLRGKRILVAEDNAMNAEIISELLKAEGAECDIASNGKEAADMFAASAKDWYDAVFMDIQMPIMNGYDAVKAIRACGHPNAVSIPIAAMTANAFAEDVQKALDCGMNTHISKPVDMKAIKEFMS